MDSLGDLQGINLPSMSGNSFWLLLMQFARLFEIQLPGSSSHFCIFTKFQIERKYSVCLFKSSWLPVE